MVMFWPRVVLAVFVVGGVLWCPARVLAQTEVASESAVATEAAEIATPAAALIVQEVTEKKPDITEVKGPTVGKLGQYILARVMEPLGIGNFLQYAIRNAILAGIPGSTIVLILLFPLVAAIIAAARHLIGLRGFGIFTPAVLSVAFVATGIVNGILLFLVILMIATLGKKILKKARLQYLPRMALLIWFVCGGVLAVLLTVPYLGFQNIMTLSIFPILILISLAETFIEAQNKTSSREAIEITFETLLLAVICSLVMNLNMVQIFVLINPEIYLLSVAVLTVFLGKYEGLRLSEYHRFRRILQK